MVSSACARNLFDDGTYLLDVSMNGVPLTQPRATRPHTPVFLGAGVDKISVANGFLSVDYYHGDGVTGSPSCRSWVATDGGYDDDGRP
jgi:hypothetical protein